MERASTANGSFRDRFYTPRVAHALTSPLAIALFALGALVGFLLLGWVGLVLGPVAYAVRIALAVPRNHAERIDPFAVNEPWRQFVSGALHSQNRFRGAVDAMRPGPLRDHLADIGARVDAAVAEIWHIAQQGQAMAHARAAIDSTQIRSDLDRATRTGESGTNPKVEALQAQLASVERMDRVIAQVKGRLELLGARIDETVTRAIEISLQAGSPDSLDPTGADVDGIVTELESVREALAATNPGSELPTFPTPSTSPATDDAGMAVVDPRNDDIDPVTRPAPPAPPPARPSGDDAPPSTP
ncbi:MAG TPA: hypothetical protein VGM93_03360 [Acidimicrobiales bacterium]